ANGHPLAFHPVRGTGQRLGRVPLPARQPPVLGLSGAPGGCPGTAPVATGDVVGRLRHSQASALRGRLRVWTPPGRPPPHGHRPGRAAPDATRAVEGVAARSAAGVHYLGTLSGEPEPYAAEPNV